MTPKDIAYFISLGVFIVGVVLFALGGVSFRVRAVMNKRAWDGKTKPLLASGIIVSIIGLIAVALTYPQ